MIDQTEPSLPNGDHKPLPTGRKKASKNRARTQQAPKRELISSDDIPRKSLEDALRIASVIKDNYGKTGASWEQIAEAMEVSANTVNNKYSLWSAGAYGIISKDEHGNYKITEIGRKILAPTFDGEDRVGIVKAIATPSILARFYSDYSSSLLPQGDIFRNVLEQKYGIPQSRVDETINLILANARYAGLLREQSDGKLTLLSTNAAVGVAVETDSREQSTASIETPAASQMGEIPTEYKKASFIITPIGDEGSLERKHADAMLKHLITPVLDKFNISAIRADMIAKPGHMTKQMVEHIAHCRLCITDLSFGNLNAGYELGIRHTLKLPSIQIVRKGDKIPFDIQQGRTIIIDTSDPYTIMDRIDSAKAELSEHVKSLLNDNAKLEESPITMYLPKLSVKIE